MSAAVAEYDSCPPAEVVNFSTAPVTTVPTSRAESVMKKLGDSTTFPMAPVAKPAEAVGSALVETVTAPPAVGVAPIVMPPNVTVTGALAAAVPVCNVSTMLDAPLAAEDAVAPPLNATEGVTPAAKKPEGYVSVTALGTASAPPAVGVKLNVTGTVCRFTTRSPGTIEKEVAVTAPPITPDATDAEAVVSALVCTLTLPPALAAPKVKPESVTVTAVLAASTAPAVVMTMEVVPGAEMGPREAPPETVPVGVELPAKKLLG